jgi:hypothetical protein
MKHSNIHHSQITNIFISLIIRCDVCIHACMCKLFCMSLPPPPIPSPFLNKKKGVNGSHPIENEMSTEEEPTKWAGQSNIFVAVRVRPMLKHDKVQKSVVKVLDHKMVVIMDPAKARDEANDVLRQHRSREKKYAFDHVFDENDDTSRVYAHTTKFMIQGVLDGYNATVFAYGQTV